MERFKCISPPRILRVSFPSLLDQHMDLNTIFFRPRRQPRPLLLKLLHRPLLQTSAVSNLALRPMLPLPIYLHISPIASVLPSLFTRTFCILLLLTSLSAPLPSSLFVQVFFFSSPSISSAHFAISFPTSPSSFLNQDGCVAHLLVSWMIEKQI